MRATTMRPATRSCRPGPTGNSAPPTMWGRTMFRSRCKAIKVMRPELSANSFRDRAIFIRLAAGRGGDCGGREQLGGVQQVRVFVGGVPEQQRELGAAQDDAVDP